MNKAKKITWSLILILFISFESAAQTVYKNPDFDSLTSSHKVIAILPFNVALKLRRKKMKKLEIEDLKKIEKIEGEAAQKALYDYFLNRKGKDSFRVRLQDITITNKILKEMGWTNNSYSRKNKKDICRKLNVDGVVDGNIVTSNLLSDEASAALYGLDILETIATLGQSGLVNPRPTNKGSCTLSILDSTTGDLLWKYEKTLSRGMGSTTKSVIDAMMHDVAGKLPYKVSK